jgi:hypothetical protein
MGASKPRVVTYDAQIYSGHNDDGQATSVNAVLNFFVPFDHPDPSDEAVFFVVGKLSLPDQNTVVEDNFDRQNYSLVIDASTVSL